MPLEEILEDLVLKSPEIPLHPTGMEGMTGGGTISDVSPETLVLALEKECNSKYEDPGEGLHFVGVSLTVFAAEIVSAYWERNAERGEFARDRGPPKMLSCLYSKDIVAFVLSHPTEVYIVLSLWKLTSRIKPT